MSKNIFVDIDKTICVTESTDYKLSKPIHKNIEIINKLYEEGHNITYWTARGTMTGIDHTELTKNQFKEWGVKYHKLMFGKPSYDILIDDKAVNTIQEFSFIKNLFT